MMSGSREIPTFVAQFNLVPGNTATYTFTQHLTCVITDVSGVILGTSPEYWEIIKNGTDLLAINSDPTLGGATPFHFNVWWAFQLDDVIQVTTGALTEIQGWFHGFFWNWDEGQGGGGD